MHSLARHAAATQPQLPCRPAIASQRPRHATLHLAASTSSTTEATSTTSSGRDKPAWSGDGPLSRLVNWLISTKPLYEMMKVMAKNEMKKSAEQRGISWDGHVDDLMACDELKEIKAELEDKRIQYPDYYLKPFHAYEEGNLNWLAAYEVQPATFAMAIRTFKAEPNLTPMEAFDKLRRNITEALKNYHAAHGLPLPLTIVDAGCSTGMSTRWLAQEFPDALVIGTDLSAYFLAVAEMEERRHMATGGARRITYLHEKAESSGLVTGSVDLLTFQFVIHECPQATIRDFIRESARLLKRGGVLGFVDNNPRSKTIQNLPPALFTLMKSTEPWSDEYYSYDVEAAMREAGFTQVVTVETDHRHRAVMGIAPGS